MTKNISVVDEFGNNYGETYLKRAKQLVKKGRAHFIDETKISLVCPPKQLEDKKMSEDKKITQSYILSKIDQIIESSSYISKAIEEVKDLPDSKGPGDTAASAKADAIANIVRSKEETNQQLIKMLNSMFYSMDFNDVKKQASMKLLEYADDPEAFENIKEALELIK